MSRTITALAILVALSFGRGCGSTRAPNQLVDARNAYQRAIIAPGVTMASAHLDEARQALDAAERAFEEEGGDSDTTKNLAYIAHRKALAAQARAEEMKAREDKRLAIAELERSTETHAVAPGGMELNRSKGEPSVTREEADARRQARVAADAKVLALLVPIEGLKTSQTDRGLVLTLPGSLLFTIGKSQLLPDAKSRLDEVAQALKDDRRTLLVVGHTDAQGAEDMNQRLSEARANAVRTYLVSTGVEGSRIRAEGMGASEPIDENASAEGRANNRRVEIVLETSTGSASSPPRR